MYAMLCYEVTVEAFSNVLKGALPRILRIRPGQDCVGCRKVVHLRSRTKCALPRTGIRIWSYVYGGPMAEA